MGWRAVPAWLLGCSPPSFTKLALQPFDEATHIGLHGALDQGALPFI